MISGLEVHSFRTDYPEINKRKPVEIGQGIMIIGKKFKNNG